MSRDAVEGRCGPEPLHLRGREEGESAAHAEAGDADFGRALREQELGRLANLADRAHEVEGVHEMVSLLSVHPYLSFVEIRHEGSVALGRNRERLALDLVGNAPPFL